MIYNFVLHDLQILTRSDVLTLMLLMAKKGQKHTQLLAKYNGKAVAEAEEANKQRVGKQLNQFWTKCSHRGKGRESDRPLETL